MLILLNKFSLFSAIFLIIYYLKLAVAQCPPSKEQLQPLMSNLKTWYAPIKSKSVFASFVILINEYLLIDTFFLNFRIKTWH